jgi:hypothetical protein
VIFLNKKIATALIITVLVASSFIMIRIPLVKANEENLAGIINNVTNNIQNMDSPWSVTYSQIFGLRGQSVFDDAVLNALSQNNYQDVIFIARLAEINGYSSQIINSSVITVLQNFPMVGSLPKTFSKSFFGMDSFLLYDRYMVNAYRYARELNISGWDINQAYIDFATEYMKPPKNSYFGEMLLINPQKSYSESYSSRYYDEHAETLSMLLEFAINGADSNITINGNQFNITSLIDDAWLNTQSHWNSAIYGYNSADGGVECEMGNFAQIIAEYRNYRGNIPYFNRVINDLENKLLIDKFNSAGWGTIGVIEHADGFPEFRLGETMGALIALQMLYPYFSLEMQTNFRDMLDNGQAWRGLIGSSLFNNSQFQFNSYMLDILEYGNDASNLGAMILFLYGIIPDTGYLAINASEEYYNDQRTCFPVSQWKFDYSNKMIRISVMQGNLSFIFGTQQISQNFPLNGIYDVYFSDDWNSILSITQIVNITEVILSDVTMQTIVRPVVPLSIPSPTPIATATPTPSPTPILAPAIVSLPIQNNSGNYLMMPQNNTVPLVNMEQPSFNQDIAIFLLVINIISISVAIVLITQNRSKKK